MSGVSDKDPWDREWKVHKSIEICDFVVEQYYKPNDPNSTYNKNSTIAFRRENFQNFLPVFFYPSRSYNPKLTLP